MFTWFSHKLKVMGKFTLRSIQYLDRKLLKPIDRKIEKAFLSYLTDPERKTAVVNKYLKRFIKRNPAENTEVIHKKLADEAQRVGDFTDLAILRGNIKRAKLAIWLSTLYVLYLYLTHQMSAPLSLLSPLVSSSLTYTSSVFGAVFLYNERINGGMVSTINVHEKCLKENANKQHEQIEIVIDQIPGSSAVKIKLMSSTLQIEKRLNKTALILLARSLLVPQPQAIIEDEKQADEHEQIMPLFHESPEDEKHEAIASLPTLSYHPIEDH
jgi:hypothetical protein